jgi:hypothetical protein
MRVLAALFLLLTLLLLLLLLFLLFLLMLLLLLLCTQKPVQGLLSHTWLLHHEATPRKGARCLSHSA